MTTSADLGISYLAGQQAQPEIIHNSALNQFQVLLSGVVSVGLNTPPGSPAQGDTYILGASPTGAWSGRANCLAGYFGTGWVFVPGNDSSGTPITMGVRQEGLRVWNKATDATYVWNGSAWVVSGMANPMTTAGDLITGGASGTPGRLAVGTNGFVLSVVAGAVAWAAATGFANPMTTSGDIIYGGASGTPTRLAAGSNGQVLTMAAGVPSWAAASGGSTGSIAAAIISGNDYPFYMGSSSGAFSYTAVVNSTVRTQFSLVQLESSLTFDHIVLAVRTASAGTSMDIGIYPFTGAGKLGACLSSANIPTTATGRISVAVTPVTLPAGLYYVAWHATSTTPACVGLNQASGFYQTPLAAVTISDAMTRLGAGTTTLACVLFADSSLPGGSYTRGMDLSALTLTSANIVGYDTTVPCVGLTKQ